MEDMIVPAPRSIALLAQLMLVATAQDFRLQGPKDGFKHIKYPDSFRTCLVQVSNSGYEAFSCAHANMMEISGYAEQVPPLVASALDILLNGDKDEIEVTLDMPLQNVQEISTKCTDLAAGVLAKFELTLQLTAELFEACTSTKSSTEEKNKETEAAIAAVKKQGEQLTSNQLKLEEQYKEWQAKLSKAEKSLYELMEKQPSDLDLFKVATIEALVGSVCNCMNAIASRKGNDSPLDPAAMVVDHLTMFSSRILAFFSGSTLDTQKAQAGARAIIDELNVIYPLATGTKYPDVVNFFTKADQLATELGAAVSSQPTYFTKAKNLEEEAIQCSTTLRTVLQLPPPPPLLTPSENDDDEPKEYGGGVVAGIQRRYEVKSAQLMEMIRLAQDGFEKARERKEKAALAHKDLMEQFEKLQLASIDFEAIRKTLIAGIKALNEVREQWVELVKFFQAISSLIKVSLGTSLKTYIGTIDTQKALALKGKLIREAKRNELYNAALKVSNTAFQVQQISAVYVDVSNKHLVSKIVHLQKLIALDPATEAAEMKKLQAEITRGCLDAQKYIEEKAKASKVKMQAVFKSQMANMATNLMGIPAEERKQITQVIRKGVETGQQWGNSTGPKDDEAS